MEALPLIQSPWKPPNTSWLTYAGRLAVVAVVEHRRLGVDGVTGHHAVVLLHLQRRGAAALARSIPRSIRAGVLSPVLAPASSGSRRWGVSVNGPQLVISACQRSREQRRRAKVTGIVAELPPPPLVVLSVVAEEAAAAQNQLFFGLQHLVLLDKGALLGVLEDAALLGKLSLFDGSRLQGQKALDRLTFTLPFPFPFPLSFSLEELLIFLNSVLSLIALHIDFLVSRLQAIDILQHIGAHNRLVVHAGTPHIGVHRSAVTMPMTVARRTTHGRRGGLAVRWLLALHVRLVQQGELTATVAFQFPPRILKAAVKYAASLAPRQALFRIPNQKPKNG